MMEMPNIFSESVVEQTIARIERLTPATQPQWGKMSVTQMLAHLNVSYEMVYDNKHPKPNILLKLILKWFVKNKVVTTVPYRRNTPTAPAFIIKDERDFGGEKKRLIDHLRKTQDLGETHFDGKESHSFGKLTVNEWNNMFYKHLDHHLTQFGV